MEFRGLNLSYDPNHIKWTGIGGNLGFQTVLPNFCIHFASYTYLSEPIGNVISIEIIAKTMDHPIYRFYNILKKIF